MVAERREPSPPKRTAAFIRREQNGLPVLVPRLERMRCVPPSWNRSAVIHGPG